MNPGEVAEVGKSGIDVQLHGHRHRTPRDETSFRQEINENRERIQALIGRKEPILLPKRAYRPEFAGWLKKNI